MENRIFQLFISSPLEMRYTIIQCMLADTKCICSVWRKILNLISEGCDSNIDLDGILGNTFDCVSGVR